MKLIGTSTAPRRASAKRSAAKACELRESTASGVPLLTPRRARPAARRSTTPSNSAKVQRVAPHWIAILCGTRLALRCSRSDRVWRRTVESMARSSWWSVHGAASPGPREPGFSGWHQACASSSGRNTRRTSEASRRLGSMVCTYEGSPRRKCAARVAWAGRCLQERSEEHTSELQSHVNLVCRLLLEKKKKINEQTHVIQNDI